jgi:hypothetical protein
MKALLALVILAVLVALLAQTGLGLLGAGAAAGALLVGYAIGWEHRARHREPT